MSDTLLIRADASPLMGTGHVMRCLALAQGWKKIGPVVFVLAQCPPALESRLRAESLEIRKLSTPAGSAEDALATSALAHENKAEWVVVDGYQFGEDYQHNIKNADRRLLCLDDYGHVGAYRADLVLNQNLSANTRLYALKEPYTHLLLGTRYALLRQEFLAWRNWQREVSTAGRKVLVTLGGADPDNITGKVVEALGSMDLEAKIVVGGSFPHRQALQSLLRSQGSAFSLLTDVSNMPELMAWADLAIAAGGTSCWELAFMGLPGIITVLAENQVGVAAALESNGISINVGCGLVFSRERLGHEVRTLLADPLHRGKMSQRGRALVDGLGVQRVVTRMQAARLTLRRAREEDCRQIWEWANDPQVRAVSFCSDPIPWENHQRWYAAKLADSHCFFYLAFLGNGSLAGQIRFELTEREGMVSVSLPPSIRGQGYGASLILRGVEEFFGESEANRIHAYIKPDNLSSVRVFEKAGFQDNGTVTHLGYTARHYVLEKEDL